MELICSLFTVHVMFFFNFQPCVLHFAAYPTLSGSMMCVRELRDGCYMSITTGFPPKSKKQISGPFSTVNSRKSWPIVLPFMSCYVVFDSKIQCSKCYLKYFLLIFCHKCRYSSITITESNNYTTPYTATLGKLYCKIIYSPTWFLSHVSTLTCDTDIEVRLYGNSLTYCYSFFTTWYPNHSSFMSIKHLCEILDGITHFRVFPMAENL